jgi:SPP1 family predicted phage head-tail adaptor
VQIQSAVRARTASGGYTESWSTDRTTSASIDPLRGREFFAEKRVQGDVTHHIRLRHSPGLTKRNRIRFRGRVFNLVEVINSQERGISHECMATEVVS